MSILNFEQFVNEKWGNQVVIKNTGEHTNKTIKELEDELSVVKKKSKKYQKNGEKVPNNIKKLENELIFAIRAKKHWPKGHI